MPLREKLNKKYELCIYYLKYLFHQHQIFAHFLSGIFVLLLVFVFVFDFLFVHLFFFSFPLEFFLFFRFLFQYSLLIIKYYFLSHLSYVKRLHLNTKKFLFHKSERKHQQQFLEIKIDKSNQ